MERTTLNARACLWVLITLHLVMLTALVTRTPPHPPLEIPLFALGPFFGAVLGISAFAVIQLKAETIQGLIAALIVAALSLLSFGPQKLLVPEIGQIWPAVATGMASAIALFFFAVNGLRARFKSPEVV